VKKSHKEYNCFHYSLSGVSGNPLILFLHGFLGSGADWNNIAARFSGRYRCLAVDLPGHGRYDESMHSGCFSIEGCAAGLIRLLDAVHCDRCFIAGYSMGGRLALYLTLRFPGRVSKAALASASPGLKTERERRERIRSDSRIADELEAGDFSLFLERWYRQPLFGNLALHPGFGDLIKRRLQNHPAGCARSLRGMGAGRQPSLWGELPDARAPVLLLAGERDEKYVSIARDMAAVCPSARTALIRNSGHAVHAENPDAFSSEIMRFFENSQEDTI